MVMGRTGTNLNVALWKGISRTGRPGGSFGNLETL